MIAGIAGVVVIMLAPSDRKARVGGFGISDLDYAAAEGTIHTALRSGSRLGVVFANAHFVSVCQDLRTEIEDHPALMVLNDGVAVNLATYLLEGRTFRANMNGTDFVPRLLAESRADLRVFLLGAAEASVEGAADTFAGYPNVRVVGAIDGYSFWHDQDGTIAAINAVAPDILLVALGCPTQEKWIVENFKRLTVPVTMGVGALFDFMSQRSRRAPPLMRRLHLEWLHRLCSEPGRLGYRYTVEAFTFFWLVAAHALREAGRGAFPKTSPSR